MTSRLMKSLLISLSILLLVAGNGFTAPLQNQMAPDFTLEDMQGNKVRLSDMKGKIVLVNFWATWCPPCIQEMPSMEKLYQKYQREDFEILAVNTEEGGRKLVEGFLKRNNFSFPILLDEDAKVQQLFNVYRLPETVIINRHGEIVNKILGGIDWMDEEIVRILDFMVNG